MAIRIGLIGAGNISETHARAAQAIPDTRIVAVYGANPARTARLAADCGAGSYTEFSRFLDHPMDLVIIGSPSGLHAEQGISAAQRGLHVLVEKPIDITTDRADALIDAADAAGVKLGVLFQDRVQPSFVRLHEGLAAGQLGRPLVISARVRWYRPPEYYRDSRWRGTWGLDGGGALMNQGIHTIDLLLWLLGPVRRVSGITATQLHSIEVEDTTLAWLEFANGAVATYEATTAAYPGYRRRVELSTTHGTIVVEHDRVVAADTRETYEHATATDAWDANASASSPIVSDGRGHQRLIEDFIESIRSNRPPTCSGREGRRSVEVAEAIYRSAREGKIVEVSS